MKLTPKSSPAARWWLGILAVVLILLFLETKGTRDAGSNFLITTNQEAQGAEVIVDGQKLGVVGTSKSSGLGGGAFWAHLTRGKHTVELRKPEFEPFSKELEMHGEAYMGVDLKPKKN